MPYVAVATDNFNRAGPALGSNWTTQNNANAGDVVIDSSIRANGSFSAQPTDQHATAVWAGAGTFGNDQYSQITVVTVSDLGPNNRVGCTVRASGSAGTRTHYEAYVINNGTGDKTTHLCRWVNGTRTAIANTTVPWVANDVMRLEVIGTALKVYRNGVEIAALSSTDANISTGKPGISSCAGNYLDDWEGGNFIAADIEQEGFRFGADDANEAGHTWLDAQDTNVTVALGTAALLRTLLNMTGGPLDQLYELRYQKNGAGGYLPVPVGTTTVYGIPTWQSAATPASGTGAVSAAMPASFAAGDLLIMVVESANEAVATPPSGWTEVSASPQGTGTAAGTTAVRLTVYAKIADGTETSINIGDAGNHTLASTFAIRGSHQTLATALHVVAGDVDGSGSTSVTCPGGTTTAPNCLVINIVANATDTATAQGSAWANANLGSVTEQLDFGTTSGNGGGITVITGTLASAGSIGNTTGTLATSSVQGRITIAVRPPADLTNDLYVVTSANIASGGEATTARLSAPSGKSTSDFVTGRRWDDENGTDSINISSADDYTELEWSLKTQAPASNGNYYDFRVYGSGAALATYSVTPRMTLLADVALSGSAVTCGATAPSIVTSVGL